VPQTYLDEDSWKILKDIQDEMKKSGIRGATLGDAVRKLKQAYDQQKQVEGGSGG